MHTDPFHYKLWNMKRMHKYETWSGLKPTQVIPVSFKPSVSTLNTRHCEKYYHVLIPISRISEVPGLFTHDLILYS